MVETQKVYKIFVASPSDLKKERESLEEVIKELNDIWNTTVGISLQLLKWETHSYPGFGEDAQDVVNQTLDEDFDIFIGILWTKFGTPTTRYNSGTLEEFEMAYDRYIKDPIALRLMIYFKEETINPFEIDLDQFNKVKEFKKRIENLGGLHWSFDSSESFTKFIRIHLSQYILGQDVSQKKLVSKLRDQDKEFIKDVENNIDDEEGFLDLIEMGTSNFEEVASVGERLTDSLNNLTENMGRNTDELNKLKVKENPENYKQAKKIVNRTASDLELFSERIRNEIPIFRKSYTTAMDSYGKAATLLGDFENESEDQIKSALEVVKNIKDTLISTNDSMLNFKESIQNQPRITTRFNHAKREAINVLDKFSEELLSSIRMADEVVNLMNSLI